jgi:Fe-S cluster assembly protein SufD
MVVATEKQIGPYLEQFTGLKNRFAAEPAWLRERRDFAFERFSQAGFPTLRHEEYKYTNLAPIARGGFRLALSSDAKVPSETVEKLALGLPGARLVFVDGQFRADLSKLGALPSGVRVESLAAVAASDPSLVEKHLTRHADPNQNALTALNTAFFQDGAWIRIPDRTVVSEPIHLLFLSAAAEPSRVTHPRLLIEAGSHAEASIIESYYGLGGNVYWTNSVVEVLAGENSHIELYKVQREELQAFHTGLIELVAERNTAIATHSLSFGGALVRNDINVLLNGEGSHCDLNGLYAVNGAQHVDHHTLIDHAKPHCTSHQLYKGVLDGRSTGVFNGKIIVRADAQKTDAIQNNKNLLLSREADVNTKPQLQIDANDVRCTHGATVGQIDKEAMFYLRSRGISHKEARNLLTYAFAADILERLRIEPIRDHFEAELMNWLTRVPAIEQTQDGQGRGERGKEKR